MMIKTKTKTKMYVGIVMGVVLVVGGAIFGSMSLNAVSALFRTSPDISTWTYVYGPGKATLKDFNNLIDYVERGADIKVKELSIVNSCYNVAILNDDIFCGSFGGITITADVNNNGGYREGFKQFLALKNRIGFFTVTTNDIWHFSGGNIETKTSSKDTDVIKWYGRK